MSTICISPDGGVSHNSRSCIILWNCIYMIGWIFIQYFALNWPWYSLRGLHIRITWFSLYGIRIPLFSLYGIHMPHLPYMVIQPIVLGMALLWVAMDSSLSQGPLLWRHNDMTVIVSRNTRGRERDTQQRLDNANARRLQTVNRIDRFFVWFNTICYAFLRNNPIYIEGRNCSFSTVPVLFNKCSGLRPSDTLLSWWLGWRRHARVGKPFLIWPLTSRGTSAWPYRVTTQYSYYIMVRIMLYLIRTWEY